MIVSFIVFIHRLGYHLKAKSRHGIHSPFVYDFIEKVINPNHQKNKETTTLPVTALKLNKKQVKLLSRISSFYCFTNISVAHKNTNEEVALNQKTIFLIDKELSLILNHRQDDMIILLHPYQSLDYYDFCKKLIESKEVKLSLDLGIMMLLLFKEDFLQKQHFVLKC